MKHPLAWSVWKWGWLKSGWMDGKEEGRKERRTAQKPGRTASATAGAEALVRNVPRASKALYFMELKLDFQNMISPRFHPGL